MKPNFMAVAKSEILNANDANERITRMKIKNIGDIRLFAAFAIQIGLFVKRRCYDHKPNFAAYRKSAIWYNNLQISGLIK